MRVPQASSLAPSLYMRLDKKWESFRRRKVRADNGLRVWSWLLTSKTNQRNRCNLRTASLHSLAPTRRLRALAAPTAQTEQNDET